METLVSTDLLMEGTHFLRDKITPYQLGWKAAAVNFSDIAAMGGSPLGVFLALSLPEALGATWTEEFLRGFLDISREYAFPLLGGDTTASPDRISICVTVLGQCPKGASLKRSGAKPGDLICVTGTLGDSAAGLELLLSGNSEGPLVEKHLLPRPRIAEGEALRGKAGAMMDISDGVASDLRHILEESGVGAELESSRLPLSDAFREFCRREGKDPVRLALCGGEDYELLFTISPTIAAGIPHTVIGRITEGSGLKLDSKECELQGYSHLV